MAGDKVYEIVTERIIKEIEEGDCKWMQKWNFSDMPRNYVSGRIYNGINVVMLMMRKMPSPYWLTFKQINDQKGMIKKGEPGSIVCFAKPVIENRKNLDGGDEQVIRRFMFRYYRVWNWSQTEGVPEKVQEVKENDRVMSCEELRAAMTTQPVIGHGKPCYRPSTDEVFMPHINEFEGSEEYYSTMWHELTHWTGHPSRLKRQGITDVMEGKGTFGSAVYSREELVAALGSAFLCSFTGIEAKTEQNNAAYLRGWLGKLKEDPKLIIKAASEAWKATEWILKDAGMKPEEM